MIDVSRLGYSSFWNKLKWEFSKGVAWRNLWAWTLTQSSYTKWIHTLILLRWAPNRIQASGTAHSFCHQQPIFSPLYTSHLHCSNTLPLSRSPSPYSSNHHHRGSSSPLSYLSTIPCSHQPQTEHPCNSSDTCSHHQGKTNSSSLGPDWLTLPSYHQARSEEKEERKKEIKKKGAASVGKRREKENKSRSRCQNSVIQSRSLGIIPSFSIWLIHDKFTSDCLCIFCVLFTRQTRFLFYLIMWFKKGIEALVFLSLCFPQNHASRNLFHFFEINKMKKKYFSCI